MSLKSRWLAAAISTALILASSADLVFAQPAGTYTGLYPTVNRVTPDASGNYVLLNVQGKQPLPVPVVQFLPGANGETIMCADFHGTRFTDATRVFQPASPEFTSVRFGQFQADPPVFRISITTSNPALLRKIDFRSGQGNLIVLFPGHSTTPVASMQQRNSSPHAVPQSRPVASSVVPHSVFTTAAQPAMRVWGTGSHPHYLQQTGQQKHAPLPESRAPKSRTPESRPLESRAAESRPSESRPSESRANDLRASGPCAAPDFMGVAKLPAMPALAPVPGEKKESSAGKPGKPSSSTDPMPPLAPDSAVLSTAFDRDKKTAQKPFVKNALKDASAGNSSIYGETANLAGAGRQAPPPQPQTTASAEKISVVDSAAGGVSVVAEGASVKIALPLSGVYKAFPLADPPRFVVDLERGLPAGTLPVAPQENSVVSQVRFGTPDGEGNLTRVVIDLIGEPTVRQEVTDEGRTLSLTVGGSVVAGRTIVLDAGHGGTDPGAQRGDISEKDLTLSITAKLRKALESKGMKVVMTRGDDTYVGLEDRVKVTNDVKPDAFVSVHINSLETNSAITGIETYYQTDQSRALAASVHDSLVKGLEVPDRNVRKARFYVVNHTPHPAILAEVGFISNKQERDRLISSEYQSKIAESISQGIISYLTTNSGKAITSNPNPTAQASPVGFAESLKGGAVDSGKKKVAQN